MPSLNSSSSADLPSTHTFLFAWRFTYDTWCMVACNAGSEECCDGLAVPRALDSSRGLSPASRAETALPWSSGGGEVRVRRRRTYAKTSFSKLQSTFTRCAKLSVDFPGASHCKGQDLATDVSGTPVPKKTPATSWGGECLSWLHRLAFGRVPKLAFRAF